MTFFGVELDDIEKLFNIGCAIVGFFASHIYNRFRRKKEKQEEEQEKRKQQKQLTIDEIETRLKECLSVSITAKKLILMKFLSQRIRDNVNQIYKDFGISTSNEFSDAWIDFHIAATDNQKFDAEELQTAASNLMKSVIRHLSKV